MSEMLEKIEELASSKSITDPVLIDDITKRFLGRRYSELAGQKDFETFVPWDIAKGLCLDERLVSECTISEILALIDMELTDDWFDPPKKDNEIFTGYFPNTASDCFIFARLLCDKRKKNAYVNQFMKIDYRAFLKYLIDHFVKNEGNAAGEAAVRKRKALIGNAYYQAMDIVFAARKSGNDLCTDGKDGSGFTVGEVLNIANKQGTAMWMCGTRPLIDYAESVRKAYLIVDSLFIDCIKRNLINMSREETRELLHKCRCAGTRSGLNIGRTVDPLIYPNTKGE